MWGGKLLDSAISELIGSIYENPWSGGSWQPVIQQIGELTGSSVVLLSAFDLVNRRLIHDHWHGPDSSRFIDAVRDYGSDMHKLDPMLIYASKRLQGGAVTSTSAARVENLGTAAELEYFRWQRAQLGIGNGTVRYTAARQGITLGISVHPSTLKGEHSPRERRLFLMLFEHVERAVRLAERMPSFERPGEIALLVDAKGQVLHVSDAALTALAQNDGLRIEAGRLRASRPADEASLRRLLHAAANASLVLGPHGVAVARPSGKRPWLVFPTLYRRERPSFGASEAYVLVLIVDPEETTALRGPTVWRDLFGLSPTELQLAQAFVEADGHFALAAEAMGLMQSTARVHLRHLFDKTGARGQASLMRLLQRIEA